MNVPKVISELVKAQNNSDSIAFSNLFSKNAIVKDEGHFYEGKEAVKKWNEATNEKYTPKIKPLKIENRKNKIIASMEVFGNFEGSPAVLNYCFEVEKEEIKALEIL